MNARLFRQGVARVTLGWESAPILRPQARPRDRRIVPAMAMAFFAGLLIGMLF